MADADEKEATLNRLSPRQASFLGYMEEQDGPVLRAAAVREFGASVVGGLETKDLVRRVDVRLDRDPAQRQSLPAGRPARSHPRPARLRERDRERHRTAHPPNVFLLHGRHRQR